MSGERLYLQFSLVNRIPSSSPKNWDSPVTQQWRTHLPMQKTGLIPDVGRFHMPQSNEARAIHYWACALELICWSPRAYSPHSATWEAAAMSRLRRTASEQPLLATARERPTRQQRPSIAKNKHINKNIVKRKSAGGSEINVEFGVDIYTPLYVKPINNKDLLYSTGNYRQYLVKPSEEKNLENGSITESFCCIPEANATVLQKNKKKGIRSFQAGVPWWLSGARKHRKHMQKTQASIPGPGRPHMQLSAWACAPEPGSYSYGAHTPQLVKPACPTPHVLQLKSPQSSTTRQYPHLLQPENSLCSHKDPAQPETSK